VDLVTPVRKISPLMNQADGSWNLGEAPFGIDTGGALGPDPAGPNDVPVFVAKLPSGGWQYYDPDPALRHYVGSFRWTNWNNIVGPHDETRASFEVVAPVTIPPGMKVVVVLLARPTSSPVRPEDGPYAPHVYPGNPAYYDLMANGPGGFHVQVAQRHIANPLFRIVGVQFVPRTTNRPQVFDMQRLRQARRAARHLLTQPPYSLNPDDLAYYADCGSFGGFIAPLAALFYPQEFHAALGYAFTAAVRSMPSDFDSFLFMTSLLGTDSSAHQYTMRDTVEIPMWCRIDLLAVLFAPHPVETHALRFFSPDTCNLVGGFGNVVTPPPPPEEGLAPTSLTHANSAGDMEGSFTFVAGHGPPRYVFSVGGELSVWDGYQWLGHKQLSTFWPTLTHGCVQAGEIDPSSPGEEVVVATTSGKITWFTLADLTTPGLILDSPELARSSARYLTETDGRVYEHRCNMSLAATWAMAALPASGTTPGKLQAIDAAGIWWEVAPDGKPTWIEDVREPASGNPIVPIGLVDASAGVLTPGTGGTGNHMWQTVASGSSVRLRSNPYIPAPSHYQWGTPPLSDLVSIEFRGGPSHGLWVLPLGGATYVDSGVTWCAWWQKIGDSPNLVQRATYAVANGTATIQDIWGSTGPDLGGGAPPPKWPPLASGYRNPIRSEFAPVAPMYAHGLRIGKVLRNRTVPQVITTTMGGLVILLDGIDGKVRSTVETIIVWPLGVMALLWAGAETTWDKRLYPLCRMA
jgi:hypothetical protein